MTKKEFDKASSNDVAKYFQCWCLLLGSATQRLQDHEESDGAFHQKRMWISEDCKDLVGCGEKVKELGGGIHSELYSNPPRPDTGKRYCSNGNWQTPKCDEKTKI